MAKKALPVNLKTHFSNFLLRRAEFDAMDRAERYAKVDPYYKGQPITVREDALMRLALRALTEPYDTEAAIRTFTARAEALDRWSPAELRRLRDRAVPPVPAAKDVLGDQDHDDAHDDQGDGAR